MPSICFNMSPAFIANSEFSCNETGCLGAERLGARPRACDLAIPTIHKPCFAVSRWLLTAAVRNNHVNYLKRPPCELTAGYLFRPLSSVLWLSALVPVADSSSDAPHNNPAGITSHCTAFEASSALATGLVDRLAGVCTPL